MRKMTWGLGQQQVMQKKTMLGILAKGINKFIRNLLRLALHPIDGARRIADKYLREKIKETANKYPMIACWSSDYISAKLCLDGWYNIEELDFLASKIFPKLKNKAVCLDIGANIGTHTLFFAQHFDKVIAFEPHPQTYQLLKINAELMDNVVPVNLGCSNINQKMRAVEPLANIGATHIIENSTKTGELNSVEFDVDLLDDMEVINCCASIAFVKIDVENHELECFEGAVNLLKRNQPVIVCEILASSISNGTSPAIEFLKKNGYEFIYELRKIGLWEKRFELVPVKNLPQKNHSMVICSAFSLS